MDPRFGELLVSWSVDLVEGHYVTIKQQALPHLREHYEPYVEALEGLREHPQSRGLWPHTKLVGVWVGAYGTSDEVELAHRTAWDREHTIGVTVSGDQITDFCASI